MELDILAFGAHPDDVELGCSGTLAKYIRSGKKAGICDLTRGELGTRGTADLRDKEAAEAAKILGLSARENLGLPDGFFGNDRESVLKVVTMIRKYRPQIVFCNAPDDRHPDHGRGSKLVSDACFYAGLPKVQSFDENGTPQEAWRPRQVFHYIQFKYMEPHFVVDISDFMEIKMASIMAYSSQFYSENSTEPSTPISSKTFLDSLSGRASDWGKAINARYAEGFIAERYLGIKDIFELI